MPTYKHNQHSEQQSITYGKLSLHAAECYTVTELKTLKQYESALVKPHQIREVEYETPS